MYTLEQGQALVELCRKAISSIFTKEAVDFSQYRAEFSVPGRVVVRLRKGSDVRSCERLAEEERPLYRAAFNAARCACLNAPNFSPLTEREQEEFVVELVVLTKPQLIRVSSPEEYLKSIKIGEDGVMISAGVYKGIMLPRIASYYDWDVERYLRQLCIKAGLAMDAWRNLNHQIFKFRVQIFKEVSPGGRIVEE